MLKLPISYLLAYVVIILQYLKMFSQLSLLRDIETEFQHVVWALMFQAART
jgi:hypothetical protein